MEAISSSTKLNKVSSCPVQRSTEEGIKQQVIPENPSRNMGYVDSRCLHLLNPEALLNVLPKQISNPKVLEQYIAKNPQLKSIIEQYGLDIKAGDYENFLKYTDEHMKQTSYIAGRICDGVKKPVDKKEDFFCFSIIMPGEKDSDWSKFSLISSRAFHAISYSDPKIIEQVKEDREEIYSKCHLKKLLGKININSFSDLLIMEAISYFDDDVANEIVSDLIKRQTMGYKPLFKGADKILDETYGRILFEEQFILLIQMVTGWDVEKTYRFFLDISYENTFNVKLEFIECAKKSGVSTKDSEELYNTLLEVSHKLMGKAFILPWVQDMWRKSYLRAYYPDAFISKEIER